MTQKHAFVVYSNTDDPGRVFHALVYAKQANARGNRAAVYFAGAATLWPDLLGNENNPMHALFSEVSQKGLVEGACENCAAAFGSTDSAHKVCGLVRGPEQSYGQIDVLGLEDDGWRVWLF